MKLFAAVVLTAASVTFAQSGLTKEERVIASFVDANQAEAIQLLERAVNINSGTQTLEDVRTPTGNARSVVLTSSGKRLFAGSSQGTTP